MKCEELKVIYQHNVRIVEYQSKNSVLTNVENHLLAQHNCDRCMAVETCYDYVPCNHFSVMPTEQQCFKNEFFCGGGGVRTCVAVCNCKCDHLLQNVTIYLNKIKIGLSTCV